MEKFNEADITILQLGPRRILLTSSPALSSTCPSMCAHRRWYNNASHDVWVFPGGADDSIAGVVIELILDTRTIALAAANSHPDYPPLYCRRRSE
jgi:hypothetical protein